MPSLLKRKRKGDDGLVPEDTPAQPAAASDQMETEERPVTTGMVVPAEPARPAEPPATYEMPGTGVVDMDRPPSYEPAPPPPPSPRYSGSLFQRALGDPGEMSPEERDRVAAAEFDQAISPVLDMMRAAVPGATTPEEAQRILAENQGEITPDPQGGAYIHGDAFEADARVYYRLLRRDYEKNPRPSERKSVSHHLHGVYGKLPGTRGW